MKSRTILLVLCAVICLAASVVAGVQGGRLFESRRCDEQALAAAGAHRKEMGSLRSEALLWADTLATGEGEAVVRSFVAGIAPAIRAGRRESLETSAVSLLRVPGVEGIHVLRPDGRVLYSSDAKLATTGEGGERAAWASAATDFATRPSFRPGVVELAEPVVDAGKVLAVVWLEFGHARVRDDARPRKAGAEPRAAATENVPGPAEAPPTKP